MTDIHTDRLLAAFPAPNEAAFFFDFDGTLVDLAPTPDGIYVPDDLPEMLKELQGSCLGSVALVSGRSVGDLAGHLPSFDGPIFGGHGAERRLEGKTLNHSLSGGEIIRRAGQAVREFADKADGLGWEIKPAGAVLHYRQRPDLEDGCRVFMTRLALDLEGLELHEAKMALELRPNNVGKDKAVAELMSLCPFLGRTPIFFGDDATDESAMSWVQTQNGVAVKVGEGVTCAKHRMSEPASVLSLLSCWLERS